MLPNRVRESRVAFGVAVFVVTALTMLVLSLTFDTSESLVVLAAASGAAGALGVGVAALLFRPPRESGSDHRAV